MTITGRIVTSLAVAAVVSIAITYIKGGGFFDPLIFAAFCVATIATALLTSLSGGAPEETGRGSKPRRQTSSTTASGPRERGKVKWFNVSKGFGFIVRENGEEIFVHFRSIRGDGRRGLRDGQAVSFVVAQSDKGPQAEDVEAD